MLSFALGVLLGALAVVALEALAVRRLRFLRSCDRDGDARASHLEPHARVKPAYPAPVIRFVRVGQDSRRESCGWLNELLCKIFFDFVGKESIQEAAVRGLNNFISEAKQQRNSKAVGNLKVTEFSVGQSLPVIKDATLLRMTSEDDDVHVLLDVYYDAGDSPPKIAIETEIAFGLNVALSVAVVEIVGQLHFVMQRNGQMHLAFSEDPDILFDIKFRAGGFVSPKVANFISRKIKTIIRQKIVEPQRLTFSLHGDRQPRRLPKLRVTVLNGEGLAAKDPNGLSDPYFIARIGEARYRSRFIPKTLDPVWNETHVFDVPQDVDCLVIEVYDHDFVGEDDFLGIATLALDGIDSGGIVCRTLTLLPRMPGEDVQGAITVELLFEGKVDDEDDGEGASKSAADGESSPSRPRATVPMPRPKLPDDSLPPMTGGLGMSASPSMNSISGLSVGGGGHQRGPSFGQGLLRKMRGEHYSAEDALKFLANVRLQLSTEMERLVEANERYLTRASYDDSGQQAPLAGTRTRIEQLRKEEGDLVDHLCTLGWQRAEIDNACEASSTDAPTSTASEFGDDLVSVDGGVPADASGVRAARERRAARPFTGNAHSFRAFNYSKPTYCEHCFKFLWGLKNQGMRCTVCTLDCHRKCSKQVAATCTVGSQLLATAVSAGHGSTGSGARGESQPINHE